MNTDTDEIIEQLIIENKLWQYQLAHINNLFQARREAIAVLDSDFHLRKMNRSFKELFFKLFGTEAQININISLFLSKISNKKINLTTACKKVLKTQKSIAILHENGQLVQENYYCYEILVSPTDNTEHCHEFILGIRDLTALKIKDHERYREHINLISKYKTGALHEISTAMAHELNQPLTAIMAYVQTCLIKWQDMNQHSDLEHVLQQIRLQAEHADQLIQSVKKIVRKNDLHYEEFDINQVIEEGIHILGYELQHTNLKIELNSPKNCTLYADKTQILQVILNLCRNSIEALKTVSKPEPRLGITVENTDDMLVVHILDNGPGVTKALKPRLFNLESSGMGIGLNICFSIIQQHQGSIVLQKSNTKVAWFTFSLPIKGAKNVIIKK